VSDPDIGANTPEDVARLRDGPDLFVVGDSLTVLFSSAGHSDQLDAGLAGALRDAVKRHRTDGVRFGIFDDRIIRVEPLVGSDGSRSYAVLLERFSADGVPVQALLERLLGLG